MIPMIAFECLSMVVVYASHMLMALAEPRAIQPKLPKKMINIVQVCGLKYAS